MENNLPKKLKTADECLLDAHQDRDYNYKDIRKAMADYAQQKQAEFIKLIEEQIKSLDFVINDKQANSYKITSGNYAKDVLNNLLTKYQAL